MWFIFGVLLGGNALVIHFLHLNIPYKYYLGKSPDLLSYIRQSLHGKK
jgi:hypothetical protein